MVGFFLSSFLDLLIPHMHVYVYPKLDPNIYRKIKLQGSKVGSCDALQKLPPWWWTTWWRTWWTFQYEESIHGRERQVLCSLQNCFILSFVKRCWKQLCNVWKTSRIEGDFQFPLYN
jgi:hypothetical protein